MLKSNNFHKNESEVRNFEKKKVFGGALCNFFFINLDFIFTLCLYFDDACDKIRGFFFCSSLFVFMSMLMSMSMAMPMQMSKPMLMPMPIAMTILMSMQMSMLMTISMSM